MGFVHTLGDSTLDNLYSAADVSKKRCMEDHLSDQLKLANYQIKRHAYAYFNIQSLLKGDAIGRIKIPGVEDYLKRKVNCVEDSFQVYPLLDLKKVVEANPQEKHFVVLSIGGDDFCWQAIIDNKRVRRNNPLSLLRDIPHIQKNYLEILRQLHDLKNQGANPILMTQFRWDPHKDLAKIYSAVHAIGIIGLSLQALSATSLGLSFVAVNRRAVIMGTALFALSGLFYLCSTCMLDFKATKGILSGQSIKITTLGYLFEKFYSPIFAYAQEKGIPVLDMTNSLNPCGASDLKPTSFGYEYNRCNNKYTHYDEPTIKGGKLIAKGIAHIVLNHDFSKQSLIYATKPCRYVKGSLPEFQSQPNPGKKGWSVAYPQPL